LGLYFFRSAIIDKHLKCIYPTKFTIKRNLVDMIKYTANDIIKRAEQLADLENSDFISDYEKLGLLNEAWQMIYQKIVNANDRTWLKWMPVYDGMCLPSDLYQISAIYIDKTREQIPKMNASQKHGYEIVNNNIFLSNDYRDAHVVMDYYPIPPSLRLRDKTIDSPFENNTLAANHSLYIDENSVIRDLNDNTVSYQIGNDFYDYALFNNAALAYIDENYTQYAWWDYDQVAGIGTEDTYPIIIDNVLYKYDDTQKQIIDTVGNIYLNKSLKVAGRDVLYMYTSPELKKIYYFTRDGYYFNDNAEKVALADRFIKLVWVEGNPYAILRGSKKIVKCSPKDVEIMPTEYVPVTFVSEKYALTRKKMSSITYLEGFTEETYLNFSNNIYFIVLAYMLAISFKNKQGADTAALYAKYNEAANQLFDGLSRDANDFYQIKNVYARNGYTIW